jgi:hypothetical protein
MFERWVNAQITQKVFVVLLIVSCKQCDVCANKLLAHTKIAIKNPLIMKKIKLKRIAEMMNAKCGTNVNYSEWPEELSLTGDELGRIVVE